MAISHVKNNTIGDVIGTVTIMNSVGSTTTAAATDLIRPSDWNSAHNQYLTISGNTAGDASALSGTNIVFQGGNNITLSASTAAGAATVVVSAGAGGGGAVPDRYFKEVIQGERLTTVAVFTAAALSARPIILPFHMEGTGLQVKTARFLMSFGASSNRSLNATFMAALYSLETNSTRMTRLVSDVATFASTNTASSANWNGIVWFDFTGMSGYTCTAEGRYAVVLQVNPAAANTANCPVTLYGADPMPAVTKAFNGTSTRALVSNEQFAPFWGVFSATSTAPPVSIAASQVLGASSASQIQFYCILKEI